MDDAVYHAVSRWLGSNQIAYPRILIALDDLPTNTILMGGVYVFMSYADYIEFERRVNYNGGNLHQ